MAVTDRYIHRMFPDGQHDPLSWVTESTISGDREGRERERAAHDGNGGVKDYVLQLRCAYSEVAKDCDSTYKRASYWDNIKSTEIILFSVFLKY